MSDLRFVIDRYTEMQSGYFQYVDAEAPLLTLDDALLSMVDMVDEHPENATQARETLMVDCGKILEKHPNCIGAYAEIASALYFNDEHVDALMWARRGFELGLSLIPDHFKGTIIWHHHVNKAFLKLHQVIIMCLKHHIMHFSFKTIDHARQETDLLQEFYREAGRHLWWNPMDNLGIRFLIAEKLENYYNENNPSPMPSRF